MSYPHFGQPWDPFHACEGCTPKLRASIWRSVRRSPKRLLGLEDSGSCLLVARAKLASFRAPCCLPPCTVFGYECEIPTACEILPCLHLTYSAPEAKYGVQIFFIFWLTSTSIRIMIVISIPQPTASDLIFIVAKTGRSLTMPLVVLSADCCSTNRYDLDIHHHTARHCCPSCHSHHCRYSRHFPSFLMSSVQWPGHVCPRQRGRDDDHCQHLKVAEAPGSAVLSMTAATEVSIVRGTLTKHETACTVALFFCPSLNPRPKRLSSPIVLQAVFGFSRRRSHHPHCTTH